MVSPTAWRVTWGDQVRQFLLDTRDGREIEQWTVGTLWEMAPDGGVVHVHESRGAPGHGTVEVQRTDGSAGILTTLRYDRLSTPRFSGGPPRLWLHGQKPIGTPAEDWLWWLRYLRPTPTDNAGQLLALDWPSGRTALRLARAGLSDYVVADDGSYVITFQTFSDHTRLCRWDVPGRKPWFWVVGIPLSVGVSLLGLRVIWTRYRAPTPDPNRSREPAT